MDNSQKSYLLLILLLCYVAGRVLQLFAGRVPSLLIVVLTVIPPVLFALIHGSRAYRFRAMFVFISLVLGVGVASESLSLRTGIPFGHYRFTDLMGPQIFGLPVLLALAYVGMGYLSWVVALVILDCDSKPLVGNKVVYLPLLASFVMTAWDLSMDPVWADIDHAWVWLNGGSYYGVPISNYFGWILTTYIFYQLFALYMSKRLIVPSNTNQWRLAILFYFLSAAGSLLAIAPASAGGVFVDAGGKRWVISSILWLSRLVSIFLMMPLSVMAWSKASRQTRNNLPPEDRTHAVPQIVTQRTVSLR